MCLYPVLPGFSNDYMYFDVCIYFSCIYCVVFCYIFKGINFPYLRQLSVVTIMYQVGHHKNRALLKELQLLCILSVNHFILINLFFCLPYLTNLSIKMYQTFKIVWLFGAILQKSLLFTYIQSLLSFP